MPTIITFGCRLNTYESEVMRTHATTAGLTNAIIFNTCAVTAEAERQARQAIRKARRENPQAKIIVTGCAAQIYPHKFAEMTEVDYVIGNDAKLKAETYLALDDEKINLDDMQEAREATINIVHGFEGIWRAFVQVQNGCDHRCTFCVIPFGRGASRSVPMEAVAEQVRTLAAEGYRETVFTGVDITGYGADLPYKPTLGQMAKHVINQVPEMPRFRLSSIDPVEVDEDLWQLIANEPRLMPHLHISLQSGDDMILKRMKRRHTAKDVVNFCERAKKLRPDMTFGADIIAGFPTETEEMFNNTLRLVKQCELTWLHVFPYSARAGTPAAKMPQVNKTTRKTRAAILREAGEQAIIRHLDSLIGKRLDVLVEQAGIGRTPTFAEVKLPMEAKVGSVVSIDCLSREGTKILTRFAV